MEQLGIPSVHIGLNIAIFDDFVDGVRCVLHCALHRWAATPAIARDANSSL